MIFRRNACQGNLNLIALTGSDRHGRTIVNSWIIQHFKKGLNFMRIRKEIRSLSDSERQTFIDALLELKRDGKYDLLVKLHDDAMGHATPWIEEPIATSIRNAPHRGPAFLPWHRQILLMLENFLVEIDCNLALPYWDWTIEAAMENPEQSIVFSEEYFGGNGETTEGWQVTTGPFAHQNGNWDIVDDGAGVRLRRQFGELTPDLPTQADVDVAMGQRAYDEFPWGRSTFNGGFRNHIEGWVRQSGNPRFRDNDTQTHNRVHVWIGGSMLPGTSPNDPLFFMHHCFIDRLWADWQRSRLQDNPDHAAHYFPVTQGPEGHRLNDAMYPWLTECITPASLLDHHRLGFQYDNEPVNSEDEFVPTTSTTTVAREGEKDAIVRYID